MFLTAQEALHWLRERGYPTPSQVVFTEPPLSEGLQQRIQEWARLVAVDSPPPPLHIYWVRLTDSAEQSKDANTYLYNLILQFQRRYPQYHAFFIVPRRRGVKLMGVYITDGRPRVASASLSEDNSRLLEALQYDPNTSTEKHWQRIVRALTGDEAMYPRIEQAFDTFLAELHEILAEVQETIKHKADEGCFSEIAELSKQAERVQQLIEETRMLRGRRNTLQSPNVPPSLRVHVPDRKKRPSHGEITSQSEYVRPLLQALVDLGGRARVEQVLNRVHELMKSRLKPKDYEKLPSGEDVRWRNAVMWLRYKLKQQGYIKPNSPKGIWEITDAGREYLKQLQAEEADESVDRPWDDDATDTSV